MSNKVPPGYWAGYLFGLIVLALIIYWVAKKIWEAQKEREKEKQK